MATKIIKFKQGNVTYVPVTTASAVQYSYNGGVMSVQDAIGTVVDSVVTSSNSVSKSITSLQTAYNNHVAEKVNLTYSTAEGLKLAGTHAGTNNVKFVSGDGVNITTSNSNGTYTLTFSNTSENVVQKLSGAAATNGAYVQLDGGDNGKVYVAGSAPKSSYGGVYITYANDKMSVEVTYTDTDTKNTAGSTNDNAKLYLVGAKSQGDNPQTFSNSVVYTQGGVTYSTTFQATTLKGNLVGSIDTTTTATTQTSTDDSTKVATTAFVHDVVDSALTSALKYKGTVANNTELSSKTKTQGDVWVVSAAGDYTVTINGSTTASTQHLEPGDYLICNGTTWDAVNGENQIDNLNATVTVGSGLTNIAKVDGTYVAIQVVDAADTVHYSDLTSYVNSISKVERTGNAAGSVIVDATKNWHDIKFTYYTPSSSTIVAYSEGVLDTAGKQIAPGITFDSYGFVSSVDPVTVKVDHVGTGQTGLLTYWKSATEHAAFTGSYGNNTNQYMYMENGIFKSHEIPSAPNNYSTINVKAHSTAVTDDISTNESQVNIGPNSNTDTLAIESVNKWIHVKGETDSVKFSHALSGNGAKTSALYKIAVDEAGHVTGTTEVNIENNKLQYDTYASSVDFTLPLGDVESTGNIITNIS